MMGARGVRAVLAGVAILAVASCTTHRDLPSIVVGVSPVADAGPQPTDETPVNGPATPGPAQPGLWAASGRGPADAVAFRGAVNVPDDLLFFLVIGSDARPGEEVTRARADSIHIVAVDPLTRRGTVLGIPRDAYVDIPGRGRGKINSALVHGGPGLLVQTTRNLTGLPISHYAVTGFAGMVAMVDELGGLDVYVRERMADRNSGAYFEPGWHHMNGDQVLAFSRNRGVPGGDFTRSSNIGSVIVHALQKARAQIADEAGIRGWLGILYRHARVDMPFEDAVRLAALARNIDPSSLVSVVAPGQGRRVGSQYVVILDEQAYALFRDVGANAVADGSTHRSDSAPTPPPGTAQPAPAPAPTPSPAPPAGPTPTPASGLLPGL